MKGMDLDSLRNETGHNAELESLKEHNKLLSTVNKRLERELAEEDRVTDRVSSMIQAWPSATPADYRRPKSVDASTLEAVMVVTDEHAEECVSREEMEGLNAYDWDTYMSRMWKYTETCRSLITERRQTAVIDKLHFISLGDQVTGEIHTDDLISNEQTLPDAIPNVAHVKAQMLRIMAAEFGEVQFSGIIGNHARTTRKKVYKKTAERNWDRAVYRLMSMLLEQQGNIEWNIPKSATDVIDIAGWKTLLMHGDQVNMNNRVPYYPIEATVQREQGMRHQARRWFEVWAENLSDQQRDAAAEIPNVEFDYAMMGHFHHRFLLADSIFGCPSPVGANTFAKEKVHAMSLPRMMLFFVHRREGIVDERPINLMNAQTNGFIDPMEEY